MSTLPPLYARFRPLFAAMDLPLRRALEGMLASFAKLPPPLHADERQITGEFVGFDGIENRGKLSNLLESEWLLRDLDPDEFVRRAAESELMFRRRDFKGTGVKNVLCVLLDCGPWMLGKNRIIALAALFYLAIRAERAGACLVWTVPGVAKGWSEDLTTENIRIFLGRIVQAPLSANAIDTALETLPGPAKECWYVGAAQTHQLAEHPDVSGSILARTRYGLDEVEVQITTRGRRASLSVPTASDADTVSALRRPFAPQQRKKQAKLPEDVGELSASPFPRDWLLDRFNRAVLIRYPNGVLWYPFDAHAKPQWIAVPPNKVLLGIQPQSKKEIAFVLGVGKSDAKTVVELEMVNVAKTSAEISTRASGFLTDEIGQLPQNAMGNLHVNLAGQCLLIAEDGESHTIRFESSSQPAPKGVWSFFSDGTYVIDIEENVLSVRNPRRGLLARTALPIEYSNLPDQPRRVLFSPDTKAVTFTTDDVRYIAITGDEITEFELEDLSLISFHSETNALAWDASRNSLVSFQWVNGKARNLQVTPIDEPINGLPRHCPLSQTVFALSKSSDGSFERFIPLQTRRGWKHVEAFDVVDAIEGAETLWL